MPTVCRFRFGSMADDEEEDRFRIASVSLDEHLVLQRTPEIDQERAVAIFDLMESNRLRLLNGPEGPYALHLAVIDRRLMLRITAPDHAPPREITVSLGGFRKIVKDYFTLCESYYEAIKRLSPSQIEAIDMGRRALHDEGADKLQQALAAHVELDHDTARRLFTLLCVLHFRGR